MLYIRNGKIFDTCIGAIHFEADFTRWIIADFFLKEGLVASIESIFIPKSALILVSFHTLLIT